MHDSLDEFKFGKFATVTALDRRQSLVFVQYLEKELTN